jgi:hypothetical protein
MSNVHIYLFSSSVLSIEPPNVYYLRLILPFNSISISLHKRKPILSTNNNLKGTLGLMGNL